MPKHSYAMTNMIRKPKKTKMSKRTAVPYDEQERYPYGLQVTLDTEELKKLGIDVKDHEVDEKVKLVCKAEITRLSSDKNEPEKERQSMGLQITDLSFDASAGLSLKQLKALNE